MLTREAWNAFLKTLEEPPPNTVFILATTEPHKVMATIVDRCQRFDFQRPSLEQIAEVIRRVAASEEIEIEDGAVGAIARAASGSFRDALGTLDQLVSYGGKAVETDDVLAVLGIADSDLILAAADAIAAGDGRAALETSRATVALRPRRDPVRPRPARPSTPADRHPHAASFRIPSRSRPAIPSAFALRPRSLSDLTLGRSVDVLSAALAAIREGDEPRMTVELALLRAARPQIDPSREAFAERLERLERTAAGSAALAAPKTEPTPDAHAAPASPDSGEGGATPPAADEQRQSHPLQRRRQRSPTPSTWKRSSACGPR